MVIYLLLFILFGDLKFIWIIFFVGGRYFFVDLVDFFDLIILLGRCWWEDRVRSKGKNVDLILGNVLEYWSSNFFESIFLYEVFKWKVVFLFLEFFIDKDKMFIEMWD